MATVARDAVNTDGGFKGFPMRMKFGEELLQHNRHIPDVRAGTPAPSDAPVVSTRDHVIIRRWAAARQAEPATGEATKSGPATVNVNDGGAGIRFNFPGTGSFRPIEWDEWLENFDRHQCAFVFENDPPEGPPSNRYRIVRAAEWKDELT
jgi:hypothetical protein